LNWLFLDRGLGTSTVAEALRAAGCVVHIHDTEFKQDEKDTVWLAAVGARGWVVLGKDRQIRTRQNELVARLTAGVAPFS
jgi:PIN like domain